jgi:hypothetical protein
MNLITILSLGIGASVFVALGAWLLLRPSGEPDLGSISRNWVTEHRNEHD